MRHLDLFSGIGCWALASQEVWPDREMVGFCEIDPFCQAVLTKHYPDVPIFGDVKTLCQDLIAASSSGISQATISSSALTATTVNTDLEYVLTKEIDILSASPPCQAASSAGRRKGTSDDRWLWDETLTILSRTRPRWAIFENVRGLLSLEGGLVFDDLLARMEKDGYEVLPFVAPAAGVGAPHQRARVWIVAHRKSEFGERQQRSGEEGGKSETKIGVRSGDARNADDPRLEGHRQSRQRADKRSARSAGRQSFADTEVGGRREEREDAGRSSGRDGTEGSGGLRPFDDARHASPDDRRERRDKRRGKSLRQKEQKATGTDLQDCRRDWGKPWQEVALERCVRDMDDGTPRRVARLPDGSTISEARLRREGLKAVGNAIVPAVAVEIMRAIKEADS